MCVLAFGHCTPNAMVSAWCKWQWWCHLQCVVPVVHGVLSVLKCACVYCSTTHVLVRLQHQQQHSNEHWAMRQFQHTGTAASSAPHGTGQRGRQPGVEALTLARHFLGPLGLGLFRPEAHGILIIGGCVGRHGVGRAFWSMTMRQMLVLRE